MKSVPVLITAYNRPEKVVDLLNSLRQSQPKIIYFSVDGPKKHRSNDLLKTQQVAAAVSVIDWECDLRMRVRESNLGIRRAIPDAVNWVMSENETVIVLEEDVVIGPQALNFAHEMLSRFEASSEIGHVSLYNVVPKSQMSKPAAELRLSKYPESVAWATWKRAWKFYDDEIEWGSKATWRDLTKVCGSKLGAVQWKLNFLDAKMGRISTWAYRWISALWANNLLSISPNVNLVTYCGSDEGSHTKTSLPWKELPVENVSLEKIQNRVLLDFKADAWLSRRVFRETAFGITLHIGITLFRSVRKEKF